VETFLLVDGYNMVFGWEYLNKIAKENLDHARDKLVQILIDHQGYIGEQIIIVFDAYNVKGNLGQVISFNKYVDIIYTKEKETADEYIEKTAKAIHRKYKVRVATSDATEQVIILGAGAIRVSAAELLEEIQLKRQTNKTYINTHPQVKNNPLESWMNKETLEKMEKLRRGKVD
jgi:predicted RNA-binding protein with PIN domain